MKFFLLIIFLLAGALSYAQMFNTTFGPPVYVSAQSVLKHKIHKLTFKEYFISDGVSRMADDYDIVFDTKGKPYKKVYFTDSQYKNKDSLLLNEHIPYDSIQYDQHKNITRVVRNKVYVESYQYDDNNREVFDFFVYYDFKRGASFTINKNQYDEQSRLIKTETKLGTSTMLDTNKVKSEYLTNYRYENDQLVYARIQKTEYNTDHKAISETVDEYQFYYENDMLMKILNTSAQRSNNNYEVFVGVD